MSGQFDTPGQKLIADRPIDWLNQFGIPHQGDVEVVESEIAFVSPRVDNALLIRDVTRRLTHFDMQSYRDPKLDVRVLKYNVFLRDLHDADVDSVVLLMRPEADCPSIRGGVLFAPDSGGTRLEFRYRLIRLWEEPAERFLQGPLGTLPLALLAKGAKERLNEVVIGVKRRLEQEPVAEAREIASCAYLLMGLCFSSEESAVLLGGLNMWKESSTYQAILEEGRREGEAHGALTLLLRRGTRRFGEPDAAIRARLEAESGIERLEELDERLDRAASWQELLA